MTTDIENTKPRYKGMWSTILCGLPPISEIPNELLNEEGQIYKTLVNKVSGEKPNFSENLDFLKKLRYRENVAKMLIDINIGNPESRNVGEYLQKLYDLTTDNDASTDNPPIIAIPEKLLNLKGFELKTEEKYKKGLTEFSDKEIFVLWRKGYDIPELARYRDVQQWLQDCNMMDMDPVVYAAVVFSDITSDIRAVHKYLKK